MIPGCLHFDVRSLCSYSCDTFQFTFLLDPFNFTEPCMIHPSTFHIRTSVDIHRFIRAHSKGNWKKTFYLKREKVFCMMQTSLISCKILLRFFSEKNFRSVFLEKTFLFPALKLFSKLLNRFSRNFYHIFVRCVGLAGTRIN